MEFQISLQRSPDIDPILGLLTQSRFDAALQEIESLLQRKPSYAEAWYLKGAIYKHKGDIAQALRAFNQAIKIRPNYKEACEELGATLELNRQPHLAAKIYEHLFKVIQKESKPSAPISHSKAAAKSMQEWFDKGAALQARGDFANALAAFRKSLAIDPTRVGTLINTGMMLCFLGQFAEAEETLMRALREQPDSYQAWNTLGNIYAGVHRFAKSIAAYRIALLADPKFPQALINIGKCYYELRRYSEAAKAYEDTLRVEPDYLEALTELVHLLYLLCRWENVGTIERHMFQVIRDGQQAAEPFITAVHAPGNLQKANAIRWCRKMYPMARAYDPARPLPMVARGDGILRIGYVSSDFQHHATAFLISQMFEHHDRSRFEIYVYSHGPNDQSDARARIAKVVEHFRDVYELTIEEAAQCIEKDEIDILIDLKGHTHGHRLGIAAQRPAPLQIHYIGQPGTIGAPFIDYFVADHVAAPPYADAMFLEKLIRLPHSYQINDRKRCLPDTPKSRTEYGLPETGFVFCDFNNPYKITPPIFAVWMRLLAAIEGSVLWLYETHTEATESLRAEASKCGIDPARIIIAGVMTQNEHLQRYAHVDLFVDTTPVCGHTTTSDALWCGVPIVTLAGDSFISSVAASLLHAVGLPELVAPDLAAYEALALALARDEGRRQQIRRHLQEGRMQFPLFDSKATTQALEAAYLHAAELHCKGIAPTAFNVLPSLAIG